jgi:hypothetical protein
MRRRRYVRPIARRRMRGRSAWKATAGRAAVAIHRPMPQRRHGPARGRMQSLQDAGEPAARCDPPAAGHADLEEGFPPSGYDKAITRVLKLALRATRREKRHQTVPVGRPGPPTEGALPTARFSRFRQLEPLVGDPQPRFFIKRAYCPLSVLPGFFSLLAELGCIVSHAR